MTDLRTSLLGLGLLCALGSMVFGQQRNILVIVADDMGVDKVGVYGEGPNPPPTPNIDALASNGVLFRNAWANPSCSPTRAAFLTGRYGIRTGVGAPVAGANSALPQAELTIPELLDRSGSGYSHACIGKWHVGNTPETNPNDQGYSHFAGFLRGAVSTGGGTGYFDWPRTVNGVTQMSQVYATTQTVDDALQWIQGTSGPWFCVVNFAAPHSPFHAPPANLHTRNLAGLSLPGDRTEFYGAAVEAMDTEIGRLLATLGSAVANTDVVFLGDNGTPGQVAEAPFVSNHAKGSPYEGGANVPFIVSGPSVVAGGREEQGLVSITDLFSTVLDLAGSQPLDYLKSDGVSLRPYLETPSLPSLRSTVYSEQFTNGQFDASGYSMMRGMQFKLITRYQGNGVTTEEFYDLMADPFEVSDLLNGTLTTAQTIELQSLRAEVLELRHPMGSVMPYGVGCAGPSGVPAIQVTGTPVVGGQYIVSLQSGPASSTAFLTLGASRDEWLGVPLPLDLSGGGAPLGCNLYASADTLVNLVTDAGGGASFALQIPNDPFFIGAAVFHTWVCIDPMLTGPLPVVTTAGIEVSAGE